MKKRIINVFLVSTFIFGLGFFSYSTYENQMDRKVTLFNVNSNNLINEESITFNDFKEDFSEEKPTEKNQNYIFNKERKKIYSNIDNMPIYLDEKLNKEEISFYINKRDEVNVIGYNKFNNIYLIKGSDENFYYVKNENFLDDKNMIFDEASGSYYINSPSSIKDYPSSSGKDVLALNVNEKIELLKDNKQGYSLIKYNDTKGYIETSKLSETKVNYVTDIQRKISNIARNNAGTYPCTANYCAAWVEGVYHAAGLGYSPCFGNAIDYWNKWNYSGSSSLENIPIGAVVVGSGSGSYMGNRYGHVGVYLGDGLVAENIGRHNVTNINNWINSQRGTCQGYHGFIGWVWPYGKSLGEGH